MRFEVWAPRPERVRLLAAGTTYDMEAGAGGWWGVEVPDDDLGGAGGVDYGFLLDDDPTPRPDPRSRRQPDGVHGLSRTDDPGAHPWQDAGWTGRALAGHTIYELHVGTFTPGGTLGSAIERLDHLVDLGVGFVELMPVTAFDGDRNWGYDGVGWWAVHEGYGGPAAYRRFVEACHVRGLAVVQDVVYNHLGPSGNYLPLFGPYLKEGRSTWGDLVNLDGEGSAAVRRFVLDNVAMWFRDLHVDALRLDAVHALVDASPTHLLEEVARETAALSAHLGRPLTLIAESDLNDARMVTPREAGGTGLDAQWSDDFHHAVHVALSGETSGYYADFAPPEALAQVLTRGFFHDGTWSSFRGRPHGRPVDTATMPGWRLVVCSQNHDQVGNRAAGDRLTAHLDEHALGTAALLTLAGPFTPMLFQGEEFAASTPFAFFVGHTDPELAEATRRGRIDEFARMGWDPDAVADPVDPATFAASRLDWSEAEHGRGARLLERYRALGRLRRALPDLTDPDLTHTQVELDIAAGDRQGERRVLLLRRGSTLVVANLGHEGVEVSLDRPRAGLPPTAVSDGPRLGLAFGTGDDVRLDGTTLHLPAHAGALLSPA